MYGKCTEISENMRKCEENVRKSRKIPYCQVSHTHERIIGSVDRDPIVIWRPANDRTFAIPNLYVKGRFGRDVKGTGEIPEGAYKLGIVGVATRSYDRIVKGGGLDRKSDRSLSTRKRNCTRKIVPEKICTIKSGR